MILFTEKNIAKMPEGTNLQIMATRPHNAHYRECLEGQLSAIDQTSTRNLSKKLLSDYDGTWHYLHELSVGYSLAIKGFEPRHEQSICGRTPDWVLSGSTPNTIVEVVSLNPPKQVLMWLDGEDPDGEMIIHGEDEVPNESRRPADTVCKKAAESKPFVDAGYPYVLAVFCDNLASINGHDAYHLLVTGEDADGKFVRCNDGGLFRHDARRLSAVLWFTGGIFPSFETLIVNPWGQVTLPDNFANAFNTI